MKNYDILHNNHVQCGYELTHYFILLPPLNGIQAQEPIPVSSISIRRRTRNRKIEPNEIAEHYSDAWAYHHIYRVAPAHVYIL